jgi:anti-anti-sigma factor
VAIVRPLEIRDRVLEGRGRLELIGELDLATVPRLTDAVDAIVARNIDRLTIDLSQLAFLDSSGLRELILLRDRAVADGWELALVRPPQPALSIFQITRAEEHLPFVDEGEGG